MLLGAGASKWAGVPLTREFVETLGLALAEEDAHRDAGAALQPHYERLISFLRDRRGSEGVDIEVVYEALVRLAAPEDDVLLVGRDHLPVTAEVAWLLKTSAEEHIRAKAFVAPENTTYLDELITLRPGESLTVFSTNYDTAIEVLCERHRLRWEDGFRVRWDPSSFRGQDINVRLHKLHGSVLWYRDQHGSYIRSPLRPNAPRGSELKWFGGRCEPLLMYPARKSAQDAPYAYGLLRLSTILGGQPRPVQLLVFGYSFRDLHLRQVIADAAVANPYLSVVLVDPAASAIFESQLRGTRAAPSPLADRVCCIDEGLDAQGLVLRALSAARLHEVASTFMRERALSRSSSVAADFLGVARTYAWSGDRHGHARCIDRLGARAEPVSRLDLLLQYGFGVLLAARGAAPETEIRAAASQLCTALRSQIQSVHRPLSNQEGNGFENWSFNASFQDRRDEVCGKLAEAQRFAEHAIETATGSSKARCAAVIVWFKWLFEFLNTIHMTSDGMGHLSFSKLVEHRVLARQPTEQEYRDPAMGKAIEEGLDRFFGATAPDRLLEEVPSSGGSS